MGANDPQDMVKAHLDPRDMVGTIYIRDHLTLLYTVQSGNIAHLR